MAIVRVLVAYVTRFGHARSVARAIADRIREHGHDAEIADLETQMRTPDDYDAVVIGSSEMLGRYPRALRAWIADHRERLAAIPTYFFSLSWRARRDHGPDPGGVMERMFRRDGFRPLRAASFAGRVAYTRYNPAQRVGLMLALALGGGPLELLDLSHDHVLTNWGGVAAFADGISAELAALPGFRNAACS